MKKQLWRLSLLAILALLVSSVPAPLFAPSKRPAGCPACATAPTSSSRGWPARFPASAASSTTSRASRTSTWSTPAKPRSCAPSARRPHPQGRLRPSGSWWRGKDALIDVMARPDVVYLAVDETTNREAHRPQPRDPDEGPRRPRGRGGGGATRRPRRWPPPTSPRSTTWRPSGTAFGRCRAAPIAFTASSAPRASAPTGRAVVGFVTNSHCSGTQGGGAEHGDVPEHQRGVQRHQR